MAEASHLKDGENKEIVEEREREEEEPNYIDISDDAQRVIPLGDVAHSSKSLFDHHIGGQRTSCQDMRLLSSDSNLLHKHRNTEEFMLDEDGPPKTGTEQDAADMEVLKSFVKAVHEKYRDDSLDDLHSAMFIPKQGPVKMTASGNIMLPRQVSMSGQCISVAGDPDLIEKMCQRVCELDLMDNNITCWDEVICLIECVPNLTFLNLTMNYLTSDLPDLRGRRLPSLTHLVLNDTMITWDVILQLLTVFPSITELHLSLNGFTSVNIPTPSLLPPTDIETPPPPSSTTSSSVPVPPPLHSYPSLRKLCFVGNHVNQWSEILKLGAFFPKLETLLISDTKVERFSDTREETAGMFSSLTMLGLNRTALCSWEEIEKLRHFQALKDVRLNGIPFLEALNEKYRRQTTVALLPNVTMLNGSPVLEAEREDAERAYIRRFLDEEHKPHRYYELERQHGRLEPLVEVEFTPKKTVTFKVIVEGPDQQVVKTETMDVDLKVTTKELRRLLSSVAERPASKIMVHMKDSCSLHIQRLIPSDRKLWSLKPQDGDEITVYCPH